jgi:hypothetical protein
MKKLLSRKDELQKELSEILKKEAAEMVEKHYPIIKKRFEGKFFKYDNGYNHQRRWPMYTFVSEILPENIYDTGGNGITSTFKGWSFQTDDSGRITIEKITHGYVHSLEKEITQSEFDKAFNKMVDKINLL